MIGLSRHERKFVYKVHDIKREAKSSEKESFHEENLSPFSHECLRTIFAKIAFSLVDIIYSLSSSTIPEFDGFIKRCGSHNPSIR